MAEGRRRMRHHQLSAICSQLPQHQPIRNSAVASQFQFSFYLSIPESFLPGVD